MNKNMHPTHQEMKSPRKAPPTSMASQASNQSGESQLISFGEKVTYTFVHGREVGSIHFDRARGEIFYKGHNIRNMELEQWQWQMLEQMRNILSSQGPGKAFAESYARALDKTILEKKHATNR